MASPSDKSGKPVDAFDTLSALLKGDAVDWIDAVLGLSPVEGFLDTKIGSSTSETIASVLVALNLLGAGKPYKLADLSAFLNQDPLDVAKALLKEALDILATQTKPLIPVGKDGGFWVVRRTEGPKQRYGIRATLPDVGKSVGAGAGGDGTTAITAADAPGAGNKPQALLQIGKWFDGEATTAASWLKRVDPSLDDAVEPGAYAYLLDVDGSTLAFNPRLELVSVGFDYAGGNDTPLISVKGATLVGFEPRLFLAMDLGTGGGTDVSWAAGLKLHQIALPLAGDLDKTTGDNAVASNLLASGGGEDGGGDTAVNPAFSVSASGKGSTINVQLYGPDDAATDRVWFPINRAFGPLNCRQIGVEWVDVDRRLSTLFDGSVSLGPLDVGLIELSVGMKVTEPTNLSAYKLGLNGLSIAYVTPGVEITGGLLRDTDADPVAYSGIARVKAGAFGLGALGSYTTIDVPGAAPTDPKTSETSLFVFAFVDYPLGGPGFFFITGLAGGFGYNRALKMPPQDKVGTMPFVAAMSDPGAIGGADATPSAALAKLASPVNWVPPTRGQNFVAGGVKFTTYELVNSVALLAVQFGTRLEIDLLGVSTIKLPQAGPTFAYADLNLLVVIAPEEGVFKASLILGPSSFVIDRKCKLTGGFAFYAWFGDNAHAGDFVVTLGGYHPAFKPPDHYPTVPRLGFNWPVSTEVTISGGAYFALTPSCAMGGGSLNVAYTSGGLKAWFTAHADLIIYWKPFYFDATIGVSLGASYTFKVFGAKVTASVSLGANLELWGPPTGGKVHVSWFVISFTIHFGEPKLHRVPTIDWAEFAKTLPTSKDSAARRALAAAAAVDPTVVSISIAEGLRTQMTENAANVWFVRPDEFTWFTKSTIPATSADIGGTAMTANRAGTAAFTDLGVRPMGIATITDGTHSVTITSGPGGIDAFDHDLDLAAQPEALWGKPATLSSLTPSATTLAGCITGVKRFHPKPHANLVGPPVIDAAAAFTFVDLVPDGVDWLPLDPKARPATSGGPKPSPTTLDSIRATLVAEAGARSAVFDALSTLGVDAGSDGDLTHLAANPTVAFIAAPMIGCVA